MTPAILQMLSAYKCFKFSQFDIEAAKRDVEPFLRDPEGLSLWSRQFFLDLVDRLKTI